MKLVFPELAACCMCIPLRYGLLVWAFFKSMFTLMQIVRTVNIFTSVSVSSRENVLLLLILLFSSVDFCFTIAFMVGAYKKHLKLVKIYFVYSLIATTMFLLSFMFTDETDLPNILAASFTVEPVVISPFSRILIDTTAFVIQAYLIILINSLIEEIKSENQTSIESGTKCAPEPTQVIDQ